MSSIGVQQRRALQLLLESSEPLSGRRVADALGVSPTTANRLLSQLEAAGAVSSVRQGRSINWSPTANPSVLLDDASSSADERTVLVATALPLEFAAVRRQLLNPRSFRSGSGTSYVEGTLPGEHLRWRVLLAEFGMGNTSAAAHFATGIAELDVDLVAFVGVAGGLKPDDDRIGDVVIADRVYNAASGKDTERDGQAVRLVRPISYSLQPRLKQLAIGMLNASEWGHSSPRRSGQPKARVGAIAAVDAVQATTRSAQMETIRSGFNDAIAIDMESLGAFAAAALHNLPAIAIRGISDFVDGKAAEADAASQPRAAANAARLLADLLNIAVVADVPRRSGLRHVDIQQIASLDEAVLPPNAQPWFERFKRAAPVLAEDLMADLSRSRTGGEPVGTWLARLLHRPPEFLRSDHTGDGWATVANIAEAAVVPRARDALRQASARALQTGDTLVSQLHSIRAELASVKPTVESAREAAEALAEVRVTSSLKPFQEFHVKALRGDMDEAVDSASAALVSLGASPYAIGLTEAIADVVDLDVPVRSQLAATVVILLARIWIQQGLEARTRSACAYALELFPESTAAVLLDRQVRINELALGLSKAIGGDLSRELHEIEREALEIRARRASWSGPTAEPLALAGQALNQLGDPRAALRLLREPPFGTASLAESKTPEVTRIAATAALMLGDSDLILKFTKDLSEDGHSAILRASALASMPNMRAEAIRQFEAVLAKHVDDTDLAIRALFGLGEFGAVDPLDPTHKAALDLIQRVDADQAELILANNDLNANRLESAIRRARSVRGSVMGAEIAASALMESGRQKDAVELLDRTGQERGDVTLRVRAMSIAVEAGLDDLGSSIANALLLQGEGRVRVRALEARLTMALRAQEWRDAATAAEQLLLATPDRLPDAWTAQVKWAMAEANYHLAQYRQAWESIRDVSFAATERHQAGLLFAIIRGIGDAGEKIPIDLFDAAISMGSAFVEDEQVAAEAVKVLLFAKTDAEPTELQTSRARTLVEDYFAKNDDTEIKRINVEDDNLDELFGFIKTTFEPQEELLRDFGEKAWLGQFPLALLSEAGSRGYAETLIKQSLNCYVALGGTSDSMTSDRASAQAAVRGTEVVIDTSALVLCSKFGARRSSLLSLFELVHFTSTLRADLGNARSALSLRSTATIGWSTRDGGPSFSEHSEEVADKWARDADEIYSDLRHVSIFDDRGTSEVSQWNSALLLAKRLDKALWADDVALRLVAQHEGVRTFSTLDLINAAREAKIDGMPSDAMVAASIVENRIVDASLGLTLPKLAAADEWDPNGYAGLVISRPAAWMNLAQGLGDYQQIIKSAPRSPQSIASWAAAGGRGLAAAVPVGARPARVGALLAWTAMNAEPMLSIEGIFSTPANDAETSADVLAEILKAGVFLQRAYFDAGDVIARTIGTLANVLVETVPPTIAARFLVRAISTLPDDLRQAAMSAFWNSSASTASQGGPSRDDAPAAAY